MKGEKTYSSHVLFVLGYYVAYVGICVPKIWDSLRAHLEGQAKERR